jgi:hypothetical protein
MRGGGQDPGADGVGVGEVDAAFDPQHRDPVGRAIVRVARDVGELVGAGDAPERRDDGRDAR